MKATGIVRKVDELGRVVIPMEIRKRYGFEENQPMEIFVQNETEHGVEVVLRKYGKSCVFCGTALSTPDKEDKKELEFHGKPVCRLCVDSLNFYLNTGKWPEH